MHTTQFPNVFEFVLWLVSFLALNIVEIGSADCERYK